MPLRKEPDNRVEGSIRRLDGGLALLVAIALVLKLGLVFRLKVQWDEFYFLSQVYSGMRGSLSSRFQNFHIHFFTWLPWVSGNEVDQVIAARAVMFLLLAGSCLFTYLLGRRVLNRSGALFSVLCYLSLSNLVEHGASFRADSICSFLFLWALYLAVKPNPGRPGHLAAGGLMALALMESLKSAFLLAALGVVFLAQLRASAARRRQVGRIGLFMGGFGVGYALLFWLHSLAIHLAAPEKTAQTLDGIFSKVLLDIPFFPGRYIFLESLYRNPFVWLLLVAGLALVILNRVELARPKRSLLLAFPALLVTLLFYRNAYPYFYVFIMSPAILLCGVVLHQAVEDFRRKKSLVFLAFAGIFVLPVAANGLRHYVGNLTDGVSPQRQLLAAVHEIFPVPVPYIDGCSAVPSFPKVGLFMSSWGMESYLAAGKPIFRRLLLERKPEFILADIPSLDLSLPRENQLTPYLYALLDEDWQVLTGNFVHHWGMLYVPGKKFAFGQGVRNADFEILVPGIYTVESPAPVVIDGRTRHPRETLRLAQGTHVINGPPGPGTVILRWGTHLRRPHRPPPSPAPFYLW